MLVPADWMARNRDKHKSCKRSDPTTTNNVSETYCFTNIVFFFVSLPSANHNSPCGWSISLSTCPQPAPAFLAFLRQQVTERTRKLNLQHRFPPFLPASSPVSALLKTSFSALRRVSSSPFVAHCTLTSSAFS